MTEQDIVFVKRCIHDDDLHRFYNNKRWLKKRNEVLELDHFECQDCKLKGNYTKATMVHHNQYVKNHPDLALEIWYIFNGKLYRNLISLCHSCHELRHGHRVKETFKPITEERWD